MIAIDITALLIALIFGILLVLLIKRNNQALLPYISYSKVADIKAEAESLRTHATSWLRPLRILAFLFLLAAFINPHFLIKKHNIISDIPPITPISTEGIAIYLILDRSGSMNDKIFTVSSQGKDTVESKMSLLKSLTYQFVGGRPSDLIGLITYARTANVLVPLTLDHNDIQNKLAVLEVVTNRDEDGTAIGYALYKTVNLISATRHFAQETANESSYQIKNSVIVLLTDGFQDPNPLDKDNAKRNIGIEEAAELARKEHVKLYIIGMDPRLNEDEQYALNRKQMKRSAELTGGKYFNVTENTSLSSIYHDIDLLEKTRLPSHEEAIIKKGSISSDYHRLNLYPGLILIGVILMLLSWLIETKVARSLP